eukprot:scaffold5781_cov85-Phaeocystis_antarctica.AAC.2
MLEAGCAATAYGLAGVTRGARKRRGEECEVAAVAPRGRRVVLPRRVTYERDAPRGEAGAADCRGLCDAHVGDVVDWWG